MATTSHAPAYWRYEELLKQLHDIIALGGCDTPEADAIRDDLDALQLQLSQAEMDHLDNLSGDLYMLQNEEVYVPIEESDEQNYMGRLRGAWILRDWNTALDLLRQDVAFREEDARAYLRSRAYKELGHLDTALRFMDYAYALNPNEIYAYLPMQILEDAGRNQEALQRAEDWLSRSNTPSSVMIKATAVLFSTTQNLDDEQAELVCERIRSPLTEALKDQLSLSRLPAEVTSLGYVVLGYVQEKIGRYLAALTAFRQVLALNPHDVVIRVEIARLERQMHSFVQKRINASKPTQTAGEDTPVPTLTFEARDLPVTFDSDFLRADLLRGPQHREDSINLVALSA